MCCFVQVLDITCFRGELLQRSGVVKQNIGTKDRVIRFVIGVILCIYAWLQSSWIALAVASFTFYEALASWCIIYQILGKNSCPVEEGQDKE